MPAEVPRPLTSAWGDRCHFYNGPGHLLNAWILRLAQESRPGNVLRGDVLLAQETKKLPLRSNPFSFRERTVETLPAQVPTMPPARERLVGPDATTHPAIMPSPMLHRTPRSKRVGSTENGSNLMAACPQLERNRGRCRVASTRSRCRVAEHTNLFCHAVAPAVVLPEPW